MANEFTIPERAIGSLPPGIVQDDDVKVGGLGTAALGDNAADNTVVADGLYPEVGDTCTSFKTAKTGWLLCNGDTLGSAASSADQQSDSYENLFTFLWDGFNDAKCPVVGGRGASAAADWAADKAITVFNAERKLTVGADTTGTRDLGDTGGAESKSIAIDNLPNTHWFADHAPVNDLQSGASGARLNPADQGGGVALDVMNPWLAQNLFIKF